MNDYKRIIDLTSHFQLGSQQVVRYIGNSHVAKGDNVAEHIARLVRLFTYISADLRKEFIDQVENVDAFLVDIYQSLIIHDDDEVIAGEDIWTVVKQHNQHDGDEVVSFTNAIRELGKDSEENLTKLFSNFRSKSSPAARIAKALDNIAGNMLVVEQKLGLISPDAAKFAIEYVRKVKGASVVIDNLIEAQISQILKYREFCKGDAGEVSRLIEILLQQEGCDKSKDELEGIIRESLMVDLERYEWVKERIGVAVWEL